MQCKEKVALYVYGEIKTAEKNKVVRPRLLRYGKTQPIGNQSLHRDEE